jgi:hypothetical protein
MGELSLSSPTNGPRLEISLLTCDGGEVDDRMETEDQAVIAYVGDRHAS